MQNYFTQPAKGWFAVLALMLAFVFSGANANAAVNDLGELELNKEYTLKDFQGYQATFTAPKTGTLVWYTVNTFMTMYNSADMNDSTIMHGDFSYVEEATHQIREYNVEEGKTYYFYEGFVMNGGSFKIYYAANALERVSISPEERTVFDIAGIGHINLDYNLNVEVSEVTLTVDGKELDKGDAFVSGTKVGIQLKGENDHELDVIGLLEKGILKGGEELVFTFTVTAVSNPDITLEETVVMICPPMPGQLVESKAMSTFLSYWYEGDEDGIIVFTFDRDLFVPTAEDAGAFGSLHYGNAESEDPGDFYYTKIPTRVEGNKLYCDLTGVRRRAADMLTTGNFYGVMRVNIDRVRDVNGHYVYSEGKGTLGSWTWVLPYEQVDCQIIHEFVPSNKVYSDTESIELWIGGYTNIRFNAEGGVKFSWTDANNEAQSVIIAADKLGAVIEEADATIQLAIPEAVRSSKEFKVELVGFVCADGIERTIEAAYEYINAPVGITGVAAGTKSVEAYDLNGVRLTTPTKGINIIKKTLVDGKIITTKVLVK